jgi:hypothetical protein
MINDRINNISLKAGKQKEKSSFWEEVAVFSDKVVSKSVSKNK